MVIPDITRAHWPVNIRKFAPHRRTLGDLVAGRALPRSVPDLLESSTASGRSVLVSGATHAGKTTMLSALISASPPEQRIITVEETFELGRPRPSSGSSRSRRRSSSRCPHPTWWRSRGANNE